MQQMGVMGGPEMKSKIENERRTVDLRAVPNVLGSRRQMFLHSY